jgi:hypothetical protein
MRAAPLQGDDMFKTLPKEEAWMFRLARPNEFVCVLHYGDDYIPISSRSYKCYDDAYTDAFSVADDYGWDIGSIECLIID